MCSETDRIGMSCRTRSRSVDSSAASHSPVPPPAPRYFDLEREGEQSDYVKSQVDAFLEVLENSPAPLADVHVIMTQIGGDSEFLPFVDTALLEAPRRVEAASVRVVELESRLDASHRFPVDRHLNSAGNRKVAEILLQALGTIEGEQAGSMLIQ